MTTRSKQSVFTALNQLRVSADFGSDDDSVEERQQERKEKLKQKKKSRNKKKNIDSSQLKDLAFVSVAKPKKVKGKKKGPANVSYASQAEDTVVANGGTEEKSQIVKPKKLQAEKSQPEPQTQQHKVASPPKEHQHQTQHPQHQKSTKASVAPPPARIPAPNEANTSQSTSETELGAIYSPTHITITRVDGQMKRTVAVTDVMDQLLRSTQQNAHLLLVQEQLGHANRQLQDQLQHSAEIINNLQNEVMMFRQMCLNLQSEVSLLRSSGVAQVAPVASGNQRRPPPGMS